MTTEVLKKKTARYLCGEAAPAERDQIQAWLSCTSDEKTGIREEERELIEKEIVNQVSAYLTSSLFFVHAQKPWWKKITASF